MSDVPSPDDCDYALLRTQLVEALAEADKCDSIVAIHIETALAALDQRYPPDQSNEH